VALVCKLETLRLETDDDIEGFAKVKTKEGTTILAEKVGLPCCRIPVPAARKLLAELNSDDGTPPIYEVAIGTETDELGATTKAEVSFRGGVDTEGELRAARLAVKAA